jgi:hypothetical protein
MFLGFTVFTHVYNVTTRKALTFRAEIDDMMNGYFPNVRAKSEKLFD